MKRQIRFLIPALLISANLLAASRAPHVLKWEVSMATDPTQKGLVMLQPGQEIVLEPGLTNTVFELLNEAVPELESEHRAASLEFILRFQQGTTVLTRTVIRADQYGKFTPAVFPAKPFDQFEPAEMELSSNDKVTVPAGADSLQIERLAVNSLSGKTETTIPYTFDIVGQSQPYLVASGNDRGDEKLSPVPFVVGKISGGKPLSLVYDEHRAVNSWVRTSPGPQFGTGFVASYSGVDSRSLTCINKDPKGYYTGYAELPHFEMKARVRFDLGEWQELPLEVLFSNWGPESMRIVFPIPFEQVSGIFRPRGPYARKDEPAIFPTNYPGKYWNPAPARINLLEVDVPMNAKTVELQTRLHAFLIATYGKQFGGAPYVGEDCTQLYGEGERVELNDTWDTPDFTDRTAWSFPVNQ